MLRNLVTVNEGTVDEDPPERFYEHRASGLSLSAGRSKLTVGAELRSAAALIAQFHEVRAETAGQNWRTRKPVS